MRAKIGDLAMTPKGVLAERRFDLFVYEVTAENGYVTYHVVDEQGSTPSGYPRFIPFVDEEDWKKRRDRAAVEKRPERNYGVRRLKSK